MRLNRGGILIQVIAFMTIGMVMLSGLVGWAMLSVRAARQTEFREQAIQISEAGIDYYRWHLAHDPVDYQDGTATSGPYVHDYYDKGGVKIGSFTLNITAPPIGSTLVMITSTGKIDSDPDVSRTIRVRLAKPSFAKYALVTNTDVWEDNVEFFGPYHANGGVHFGNVVAHNIVTSALPTYTDPDFGGNRFGVYTDKSLLPTYPTGDPAPPGALPNRPDVFMAGRQVAVPAVDFSGMMSDLSAIKTGAQTSGLYYSASGVAGYHIVLKTNGTFDIYRVTSALTSGSNTCKANYVYADPDGGMWSVNTQALLTAGVPYPANGLIFVEDDVWVDGTINGARLTIAAARFPDSPATRASIIVNNNLKYTNTDGTDVIGLIAQDYIRVGYASANNLEIDGALVAQSGALWRDYYHSFCGGSHKRNSITTYGAMVSNQRYTFSWWCGSYCSGYASQLSQYDPNLLYGPPPSFPLTTDQYETISWEEI